MKVCSKCKESKPLSDFTKDKNGKSGVHHYCKVCLRSNKNKGYSYHKSRARRLIATYNITESELALMYESQNGKCKICGEPKEFISKRKGLVVDHNHITGEIRGLLCYSCNTFIGNAQDNVDVLKSAIIYLSNG